ncbi:MAG TPA: hypothetical protein VJ955_06485 [Desulfuromonadales bacterium]|nr:hypothetical protein [Desulfuromonadales bacterium]
MLLFLLVPMTLLCAVLAWMSWRASHRRVALTMAGVSLVCLILSAGTVWGSYYLYEALQIPGGGRSITASTASAPRVAKSP